MVVKGHVENGVVVLHGGVTLPEGREVTVVAPTTIGTESNVQIPITEERKQALLALIGICKTDNPPSDQEVERIIEEERMKKYG